MKHAPAHTGVCDRCDALVIDAHHADRVIRLDAQPVETGEWTAWNRGDLWITAPHGTYQHFAGLRRREHICIVPDKQLELA